MNKLIIFLLLTCVATYNAMVDFKSLEPKIMHAKNALKSGFQSLTDPIVLEVIKLDTSTIEKNIQERTATFLFLAKKHYPGLLVADLRTLIGKSVFNKELSLIGQIAAIKNNYNYKRNRMREKDEVLNDISESSVYSFRFAFS